jgi:uncharacterized RDD family membrane protein YckC
VSDFPSLPDQRTRASFGTRLVAVFIDFMAVVVVERLLIALLGALGFLLALFAGLAYFTYFEGSSSGQTIGKRAMSIRVVDATNLGPVSPGRAALRYLGRLVSGLALFIGYLWAIWDPESQTWHDKIAATFVVPVDAYPVAAWPGAFPSSPS